MLCQSLCEHNCTVKAGKCGFEIVYFMSCEIVCVFAFTSAGTWLTRNAVGSFEVGVLVCGAVCTLKSIVDTGTCVRNAVNCVRDCRRDCRCVR
jgi:hypothetical protein